MSSHHGIRCTLTSESHYLPSLKARRNRVSLKHWLSLILKWCGLYQLPYGKLLSPPQLRMSRTRTAQGESPDPSIYPFASDCATTFKPYCLFSPVPWFPHKNFVSSTEHFSSLHCFFQFLFYLKSPLCSLMCNSFVTHRTHFKHYFYTATKIRSCNNHWIPARTQAIYMYYII